MQRLEPESRFAKLQVNLACFEVAGRLYALDVLQVQEIVRSQATTPLPKAPPLIEGVIDLRGTVIPVLDLARALDQGVVEETTRTRIVVTECDGLVLGLRVGAAVDVLSLPATALEDPPPLAVHAGYQTVRAVVRRDGQAPVMVLSVEHVLESVYASARAAHCDAPGAERAAEGRS